MALTRIKTWISGEILTHTDLNGEFDNFLNNASSLVSPWTSNIDAGGFRLTALSLGSLGSPSLQFTNDSNTGIWSSAADTIDVSTGGSRAAQLGASWLLSASPEDSRTDSVDVVGEIRSTTSSTPSAGIGTGIKFSAESADENPSDVGEIDFAFSDVTAASEDSYASLLLRNAGAALGERYRFQASDAFRAVFTHSALTAARTITIPDADITLGTVGTKGQTTLGSTFSTTSDTFVDVTGLAVTITTGTNRALILFSAGSNNDTATRGCIFTVTQDSTNLGGTNGLSQTSSSDAADKETAAFTFLTNILTAASHTFQIQLRRDGAGTANMSGNPTAVLTVIELQ